MSLRERSVASQDAQEAFSINLTPMIDVVFQLIIFFMCAMKFKVLEEKLKLDLPKGYGISTPMDLPPPMSVRVRVRQAPEEGVPRIYLLNEEIRPELGRGAGAAPGNPGSDADRATREAAMARQRAHWSRYVAPKLAVLEEKLKHCLRVAGQEMPYEVDAAPNVRHEYAVGVIDTVVAAGIKNVTIRGTRPSRSGR